MKTRNKLIITFIPTVILAASLIGINGIDPFYKTKSTIPAKIIKRIHATGKTGARIEISIKTVEGKEYWFNRSAYFTGKVGDNVKLRLYERRYTGLQKYELEI